MSNRLEKLNSEFIQYHHAVKDTIIPLSCGNPCPECLFNDLRIFANDGTQPPVGEENHLMCHCYYDEVKQKPVGSISKMAFANVVSPSSLDTPLTPIDVKFVAIKPFTDS